MSLISKKNIYLLAKSDFDLINKKKPLDGLKILDIGCGRGKIFGSLSRKLKLINKPIGIDPVSHKDVDRSINFKNDDIFEFFKKLKQDINDVGCGGNPTETINFKNRIFNLQ